MLSTGKNATYLKYAVGEIILVVIGILIALQINNWNEQRKTEINERALYSRMILDLKTDENRIQQSIKHFEKDLELLSAIYQETQGVPAADSIINFGYLRVGRIFDLNITSNYYENIKEISRPKITESLYQYFIYEQRVHDAFEQIWEFKEVQTKPYLAKYGINDAKELFENLHLPYPQLREKNILTYSKLEDQYGTVELEQMLFDLGVRTSWSKSSLEDLLPANQQLQSDLTDILND